MNMTILTQNDVFLNYDHIIAIRVYSGEVSLDNGKTIISGRCRFIYANFESGRNRKRTGSPTDAD